MITRKQEITSRIKGEPDLYSIVRNTDVLVAVESAKAIATFTGRVVDLEQIEIVAIIEFDQDEDGNSVGGEAVIYELRGVR